MYRIITGLAAVASIVCLAAPAHATAPNECPPANGRNILWDVNTEPYHADNAADEHGNGDGLVCARPTKIVIDENGDPFQLYNFIDN
jgi:hypothetical protein